jgi:hypothetical protein
MKKSGWRLAVAVVLFFCWIGYLAYLAATTTQPTVLSRPQFLIADLYVVAVLAADPATPQEPTNEVTVKKVIWSAKGEDFKQPKMTVENLKTLAQLGGCGWEGPGEYILALSRTKDNRGVYQVTPLPRTPGFNGAAGRIYMATPSTLRQLEQLKEEYHPDGRKMVIDGI